MRTGRPCARLRVARRRLVGRLHGLRLARAGLQHRGELPVFGGRVLRALAGAAAASTSAGCEVSQSMASSTVLGPWLPTCACAAACNFRVG